MVAERDVSAARAAVRAASQLCRRAQGRLASGHTFTKGDHSPVTIADYAAQAVVAAILVEALGELVMVGEEDAGELERPGALLDGVVELVSGQLGRPVGAATVRELVDAGDADGSARRYWTLDPIDGTKGFLRGDQYAIALALVEEGEVVLGVLGCPNLPNPDGTIGATFVAVDGASTVHHGDRADAVPVRVASPASLAEARFCESVESGHSSHDDSARIADLLGIRAEPYRIDSQCKYGAVARGDASIYLRLPTRADYREKVWDHAAGKFVVEQAGGRVTDVVGATLDFSRGPRLEANRGVVATDGRFHDDVLEAIARVLPDT